LSVLALRGPSGMAVKQGVPDIESIEDSVDEKEILRLSRQLIAIPSTYTHEERISRFIFDKLDRWDLSPKRVPVKGHGDDVVASVGSREHPAIVLNGHMDTVDVASGWVHDPFDPVVEKGFLFGLGSLDMKCGLAALMVAFKALAESGSVKGYRVCFHAVSGEEDTGAGTRTLVERGEFAGAKAVIVGEGFGGLRAITNSRRGGSYYDIEVRGKSAHGATPHLGINAVVDASKMICALDQMKLKRAGGIEGDDFNPLTESQAVLSISGGSPALSVPDSCKIRLVRSTLPGKGIDATKEITAVLRRLRLRSKVKVTLIRNREDPYWPYLTDPASPLVRTAVDAVKVHTGVSPRLVCGVSEADDNIIAHELGLPVISLGPGEAGAQSRYHQAEESISIAQLGVASRVYCRLIVRLGALYSS